MLHVQTHLTLLLPQADGHACVDFVHTHPIDVLF
jgi:hypothetical protein